MNPLRWLALVLAVVAFLMVLSCGPGSRFGLWDFRVGFTIMRWAVYCGLTAAGLALVLLIVQAVRGGGGLAVLFVALLLGCGAAYGPWSFFRQAGKVPAIHDITTDTTEPPQFVAVLALRAGARNPPEYGGAAIAAEQQKAYPDVQPLHLDVAPAAAFARALTAARGMGWEIAAAQESEGRIEATATTFWFGFKDDVVVRVRAEGAGSRIDVRSLSRVGKSDVGANAKRILAYLARLRG